MATLKKGMRDNHSEGPVHSAQFLLAGHNVFRKQWLHGPIDGVFGPATAEACKKAKYVLGYPDRSVLPVFGDTLRAYLLGQKRLPIAYKMRMQLRAVAGQPKYIYPASKRYPLIGYPGQGTHSWDNPPNNWESDNAWDVAFPYGTDLFAVADGTIGDQIGYIGDPASAGRFAGQRLHLVTADNEFYYAHMSRIDVKAGWFVKQGSVLGKSGAANGVNHLHLGVKNYHDFELILL